MYVIYKTSLGDFRAANLFITSLKSTLIAMSFSIDNRAKSASLD